MTNAEVAVMQAAMEYTVLWYANAFIPISDKVEDAKKRLIVACDELANENDGSYNWFPEE